MHVWCALLLPAKGSKHYKKSHQLLVSFQTLLLGDNFFAKQLTGMYKCCPHSIMKLEQDRVTCSTWRGKFLGITWCFSLVYFLCSCLVVFIRSPFPAFSIKSWEIRFITKWCSWKFFKAFAASWKYSKTPYKQWCQCNKHVFTHTTNIYLPTFFEPRVRDFYPTSARIFDREPDHIWR